MNVFQDVFQETRVIFRATLLIKFAFTDFILFYICSLLDGTKKEAKKHARAYMIHIALVLLS